MMKPSPMASRKKYFKIINETFIDLPTPPNISYWWNMGSMLILCLLLQISTGIFLAMHYSPDTTLAFKSISHLIRDVPNGWLLRSIHANGASLFFVAIYLHMGRGLYYGLYKQTTVWLSGVILLVMLMGTAFLGYVLPWGQMSYWGATVITNLLSAIPYIGPTTVTWLWGGHAINNATLTRFYSLHYLMPFLLLFMTMTHIMLLHHKGSSNPLALNSNIDKIPFHPFFTSKDLMGYMLVLPIFLTITLAYPQLLGDPENFNPANPLVTPIHIQPEWYFLFAYAILRSIPNKLGGVIALALSIAILTSPTTMTQTKFTSTTFYPLNKILFWLFITVVILLTWIGASPVETPYLEMGQTLTILYFLFFPLNWMLMWMWDQTQ